MAQIILGSKIEMSISLLQVANDLFNVGKYQEALSSYETAAKLYGERLISANLRICRKRIEAKAKVGKNAVLRPISWSKNKNLGGVLQEGLGIEKIYIVNLSRRLDRFVRVIREMNMHDIACTRVEGVDAKYSIEANRLFNEFKSRNFNEIRNSSKHIPISRLRKYKDILTVGVFGYILSQKKIFEDAKKNKYKKILICDDDIFWHSQALKKIEDISKVLKQEFKILLLGSSEYSDRSNPEFIKSFVKDSEMLYHPIPGKTCGSFAVVYDISVYGEILKAIEEADGPFDNVALGSIYEKYGNECFSVTPAICIPNVDDSDIRNSERTQISHSERMNWETLRFREFKRDFNVGIIATSFTSLNLISKVRAEIYPGINLRIFYLSEDGFRVVIPGHEFFPKDEQPRSLEWNDVTQFKLLLEHHKLPDIDIAISWPEEKEITGGNVIKALSKILEEINTEHIPSGFYHSHFYCTEYRRKIQNGKHSIIIPCYRNIDESIATIQSALLQDANDFEVIVVNDNPGNKCFEKALKEKLKPWADMQKRRNILNNLVIVEHKKNRNAAAARNTGMMHSNGEWITFLDDDDYFEPNRLSAVESILQLSEENYGACYCGYTGNWNGKIDMNRFPEGNLGDKVIALKYADHYMCTNTITFKRAALEELGGFDESYIRHQDLELMTRFFVKFEIKAVKQFLVKNRPVKVNPTFKVDTQALVQLKIKFLRDLRDILNCKEADFIEDILDAHVCDIFKNQKDTPQEVKDITRSMLQEVVL